MGSVRMREPPRAARPTGGRYSDGRLISTESVQMTAEILSKDTKLKLIVERLIAAYQPDRIYLFGSIARGEADADSDYDLMVIVPDDATDERKDSRLAYQVLRGTGAAADVLVWTRTRFERRAHVVASLPATILREGQLVHAA